MEKAVLAEVERQTEIINSGEKVKQENRGYNEATGKTVPQRDKEEAHDYRYFPEPDIPPMVFDDDHINKIKARLPKSLTDYATEFIKYDISMDVVKTIVYVLDLSEKLHAIIHQGVEPKKAANYLANKKEYQDLSVEEFVKKVKSEDTKTTDESQLTDFAKIVIEKNAKAVEDYKKGSA
jgi:aspartyl-tRNA(Asn)/glutamyl-tRNA(Gln) amidotransferase subunit B